MFPYQDLAINGKPRFFKADIWHTIQLGTGKDFAAAAMVLLVGLLPASNVDERFNLLSAEYINFCKAFHKVKYVKKLDKKMVGGAGSTDEPYGTWNKGSLTTTLLEFWDHYCKKNKDQLLANEDARFKYIVAAVGSINEFMATLYHHDLWIPAREAKRIALAGKHFFKCYLYLSFLSAEKGQPYFAIRPKLHMLFECAVSLELQAEKASFCLNTLAESCSIDEDFVGRLCFLARKVSPRLVSQRSIERYLTQAYLAWSEG